MEERNVIYRMRFLGHSDAEIARCLGRHRSTIGRERKRNAMLDGRYESGPAQTRANSRRRAHLRRSKTGHRHLMAYVAERLADRWSPEQIAGRLSVRPPADLQGLSISHTTIYRWIWSDPERTRQFRPFLRIAQKLRRKPSGKPSRQSQILGKRSIEERPAEANERTHLGHWEGDTMVGKGRRGFLATCADRASRYRIARKVKACAAEPVAQRLQQTIRPLPAAKRRSLTVDNGHEFARSTIGPANASASKRRLRSSIPARRDSSCGQLPSAIHWQRRAEDRACPCEGRGRCWEARVPKRDAWRLGSQPEHRSGPGTVGDVVAIQRRIILYPASGPKR
jgi:IS30 family transposase